SVVAEARASRGRALARVRRGAAVRHLLCGRPRQQRGDGTAEAFEPEVILAQAVEEKEARLDRGMLEFPLDEFERRERAHGEEPPAGAGVREQFAPLRGRQRRCAPPGCQGLPPDWPELLLPPPPRVRVALA